MKQGLIKVTACAPRIRVADVTYNTERLIEEAKAAAERGVSVLVFPELSMTAYTSNDLLYEETLIDAAERGMERFISETADLPLISFVGVPVRACGRLYNCGAAVCGGRLLGLVPKYALCNYGEFNDARWFAKPAKENIPVHYAKTDTLLGIKQVFCCRSVPSLTISAELCEDVWTASPVSSEHTCAGATLIVNLCCSDEFFGKRDLRRDLTRIQSRKACCAYMLADAGDGESTTDMVFSGNHIICQLGEVIAEKAPFSEGTCLDAVLDMGLVKCRRMRSNLPPETGYSYIYFDLPLSETAIAVPPCRTPFIPQDGSGCDTVLNIQTAALCARMRHTGAKTMVLGVSGGLDSTLALLVCSLCADKLGMPRSSVLALTMPCFGTTSRTRSNAEKLAELTGATLRTVDIRGSVVRHFSDIGHPEGVYDAVYENAQARERTQVLMDVANQTSGLVIGTGDLSELALGWATYNGDHMSMYCVNGSVPKTLIRHVLGEYAKRISPVQPELARVIEDVINTPVSPELLPSDGGDMAQQTEELVGPYELHDFFIWHMIYNGASPKKIMRLACAAFDGIYDRGMIKTTLRTFIRRFFSQQFKRSCMPDGPKVTQISLSPRGGMHMPSDARAELWLAELEECEP